MLCNLRPSSHSHTPYGSKVVTLRKLFRQYPNERVKAYSVFGLCRSMYID